ncbi:hypothetical protein MJD09_22235 [bacterium]|nr:hypothetical protein [bacterium]
MMRYSALQLMRSLLLKTTQPGVSTVSALVALLLSTSCSQTELTLDKAFDTYIPKIRVGVKKISIERSRVIQYFGFRNVNEYSARIDLNEIKKRNGRKGEVNDITLEIANGRMTKFYRPTGTLVPEVDEYIEGIVKRWYDAPDNRFTEFVDELKMVVKIDQGGEFEVIFEDFKITQPIGANDRYQHFNAISKDFGKMQYLVPLSGFRIRDVRTTQVDQQFQELDAALQSWKRLRPDFLTEK